jgi:polyisoprenoid-binding protein YceI
MTKWKIDSTHTTASFKVQHLGIAWILGHVYGVTGDIDFDPANVSQAKFAAAIDLNTLTTGNTMRDSHLKSADFFDIENHPQMVFESSGVQQLSENDYEIKGELAIRGAAKPVVVKAKYLGETDKTTMDGSIVHVAAFSLQTQLDRRDFGLTWNIELPSGKLLVGNEVYINIELEAI